MSIVTGRRRIIRITNSRALLLFYFLSVFGFSSVSDIMPKDVVRLMAAVSVGYGTFNLMVSLLPPTVISVIGVLGFRGNRQTGLDALAFAKNGPDVHAPLAW
jgi:hypothetical protein